MLPPESMKWVALFLLVVQNTALVLLMRSSLTTPGEHYIVTTAVACMEVSLCPGGETGEARCNRNVDYLYRAQTQCHHVIIYAHNNTVRQGRDVFGRGRMGKSYLCVSFSRHYHSSSRAPVLLSTQPIPPVSPPPSFRIPSCPPFVSIFNLSSYLSCPPPQKQQNFKRLPDFLTHLRREVFKPRELLLLSVPSLLYTLQNNLLYIALANLDAAIYQVCYQLKILTTALFSVLLLKRALSRTKWISLIILTVGVSLTELDAHKVKPSSSASDDQSPTLGFLCVLMACLTSGFAGVWFEKILKGVGSRAPPPLSGKAAAAAAADDGIAGGGNSSSSSLLVGPGPATRRLSTNSSFTAPSTSSSSSSSTPSSAPSTTAAAADSMWIRNIQMGATSVVMALLAVYSKDGAVVAEKGFFYGYNQAVIGVILLQALGGLVVALVVVHADNIMKGFGSSISIVLSCTLEWLFFDFQPSLRFVMGAGLVNFALYVYQNEGLPRFLGGPGQLHGISAGGSGVGGGGGKEGKIGTGGVTALLGGLVGAGGANGNSSSSSGGSSSSTGGGILPTYILKSHARDVKGWFGSGTARKTALSPPSAAAASAMYLKNGFDSRGREGGGVKGVK